MAKEKFLAIHMNKGELWADTSSLNSAHKINIMSLQLQIASVLHSLVPEGWQAFQSRQNRLWLGRKAVLQAVVISFQNTSHKTQDHSS